MPSEAAVVPAETLPWARTRAGIQPGGICGFVNSPVLQRLLSREMVGPPGLEPGTNGL